MSSIALVIALGTSAIVLDGRDEFVDATGARSIERPGLVASGTSRGGVDAARGTSWMPLGPFGGDVQDVNVSPVNANIMLAGIAPGGSSGGAMFRSTDAGQSWTVISALASTSIYDIEFASNGTVYAASIDSVRKSIDGGASFTTLNLNIGLNDQVFDLAIDPNNPNVIWIGIADALGSQPVNVMQSVDGGATWTNRTPPMGVARSCRAIAINPNNSQEVYAGFTQGQLWMSTNGGVSWVNRSAGLPGAPINALVHDGTRIMVCGGQLFGGQNFGLYQSVNQCLTWTPLHDGTWPSLVINDLAIDPNNASTRYVVSATAGVFRSVNGGPWQFGVGGTGSMSLNAVRFANGSSSHLLLGANAIAVLQSTDSGASFAITSFGISKLNVISIAANPNNNDELAIAFEGLNDGGVYASTDGGQNWTLQSVPPTRYSHVAFAPDGTLHAISDGPTSIAPEGVYRRNPNGTWTNLGPDQGTLFESELKVLRFSDSNPSLIMAGGNDFGVAGFEPTIWRNTSGGAIGSWQKVYEGPQPNESVSDIQIVAGSADQIMIATFEDFGSSPQTGGVLRSTTGGSTGSWSPSNTGLPATAQPIALSPSPTSPNAFRLADRQSGASGGLYQTVDGGVSWSSTGFAGSVRDVASDPHDAQTVYIMQGNSTAVWKSTDAGATFSPFNAGLSFSGFATSLFYADGPTPKLLLSTSAGSFGIDLPLPGNPADITGDGVVNVNDLLAVINGWGACDAPCPPACDADIAPTGGDCNVNVNDLLMVINNWG